MEDYDLEEARYGVKGENLPVSLGKQYFIRTRPEKLLWPATRIGCASRVCHNVRFWRTTQTSFPQISEVG